MSISSKYMRLFTIFFIIFCKNVYGENQPGWEEHSEAITILSIEEVETIVKTRNVIMIDTWKKDEKPKVLDKKKWLPPQRYSIPGSYWLPNIGLEVLTPERRIYLVSQLEKITKGNKNKKIVFFCRRGYYSKIAAERAVNLGYTNIFLFPGTDLWEDAGKRLVIIKPQS